ncbi:hypothetical protein ROM83_06085 [Cronobacter sakazakii]|uniref:hypothetical protein n=1 Tax=Cronobacter sakazakii TaxID=28141 RepID=UPI00277BDE20|nr:hypothetical protein [Cronobacter sakazakii]EKY1907520.1 hypothetical protein [Cronobacter sakazakii]ELQ6012489.1 hypothetical protein [Cronobacter sakazakii]ELY3796585.1 hypothetical protein [Cronobacter sakazakii]ELY3827798.1 hypothetical protein [Cronobacter sakazakii]ELY4134808.1 hypothetical protein [Cronobacter sakazakii]
MNYEKTKELVKSGHQLVVLLGTQNGMHEAASLVQRMAGQLDILAAVLNGKTKLCEQLTGENAALKSAIQTHSESVHFCEVCGKDDPCSTDDVCHVLKETPDTEACLREVKAQGAESTAAYIKLSIQHLPEDQRITYHDAIELCSGAAALLRKGGAA